MSVHSSEGHICKSCNKVYKSRQSLCNHRSKFHYYEIPLNSTQIHINNEILPPNSTNNTAINKNICATQDKSQDTKALRCSFCNNEFSRSDSLKRHMDKCKVKINNDKSKDEIIAMLQETIKEERALFQKQFLEMQESTKQQLLQLMNKQCKTHPKTLQKINNQLNANNSNINSNNTTNNTINILAIGHEDLAEVFTKKEKLTVLKNKFNCLPYLIEYTHFNDKYPQFKNIMITNMQNSIAYKFDYKQNQFVAIDKNELLNDLVGERMADIEAFYDELESELDDKTKKIIDRVIDKFENNPEYKEEKKKEIKLIIYQTC
jgi:uncharacterized C2H2 Zn-finger protein